MKCLVLLALVAMAAAGVQRAERKTHLVQLDMNLYHNREEATAFGKLLEKEISIKFQRVFNLKTVIMLKIQATAAEAALVRARDGVTIVAEDQPTEAFQTCTQQAAGCWGLDRIDQREPVPYIYPDDPLATYIWGDHQGSSVVVYVGDTGIELSHPEFEGRARFGYKAEEIPWQGDYNGHGTHVAGTIGSLNYGVAKSVQLVDVTMLDENASGWMSWIVEGMEWIIEDHIARSGSGTAKSVVNLSLGGAGYDPVDNTVRAATEVGIVVVVAAGNSNADACLFSPAREPTAMTIGNHGMEDDTAVNTNWGSCVDIFAPGTWIYSTYLGGSVESLSGTSMASPHVAGVVARYQDGLSQPDTPANVDWYIKNTGTRDALTWTYPDHSRSDNLILFDTC